MGFSRLTDACLLTTEEMYKADQLAIDTGVSGAVLMENAGKAVFDVIVRNYTPRKTYVLCGPGNNGGDGFVVARLLKNVGWDVSLYLLGDVEKLQGDAAFMAKQWVGDIVSLADETIFEADLVIDALFGAGLNKDIEGDALSILKMLKGKSVVAIDVPSGINGNTGQIMGHAAKAAHTVSFFRGKPAHYLVPSRIYCGQLTIADIGIDKSVLHDISPAIMRNSPDLWRELIPIPKYDDHKYSRGYALITGGKDMIGAATLSARAAQRVGAGIVSIASPEKVAPLYRLALQSVVVHSYRDTAYYNKILEDKRIGACLIGPGLGQDFTAQEKVLTTLRSGHRCVLDADGLSMFEGHADLLMKNIVYDCVITPHEGEFSKLFPGLIGSDKIARVKEAAKLSGAVVLLKGSDTVIATPDGQVVINYNAPSYLATAGAGDVLAGMIVGFMAQGCDSFVASIMASWMHGEAAQQFGVGLIAEDLVDKIPSVISSLLTLDLN